MDTLRMVLTIVLLLDSIVMAILVLMQEGKSEGLGAIAGAADTYWGKNKARSMEGKLAKFTFFCGVLFFVISIVLNIRF